MSQFKAADGRGEKRGLLQPSEGLLTDSIALATRDQSRFGPKLSYTFIGHFPDLSLFLLFV